MLLERLAPAFALIAAFAVVGGFIDFCLGKAGQEAVRRRLEDYWLRFSYVKPSNVGRREARFAAEILQEIIRFDSIYRQALLFSCLFVFIFNYLSIIQFLSSSDKYNSRQHFFIALEICLYMYSFIYMSLYVTYRFALFSGDHMPDSVAVNVAYFIVIFLLQSFMINFGSTAISFLASCTQLIGKNILSYIPLRYLEAVPIAFDIDGIRDISAGNTQFIKNMGDLYRDLIDQLTDYRNYILSFRLRIVPLRLLQQNPEFFLHFYVSLFLNWFRIGIVMIFLVSVALQKFHDVIEIFWLRVIEEKKPIFTFVFGGIAAIAKFIQEMARAFSA